MLSNPTWSPRIPPAQLGDGSHYYLVSRRRALGSPTIWRGCGPRKKRRSGASYQGLSIAEQNEVVLRRSIADIRNPDRAGASSNSHLQRGPTRDGVGQLHDARFRHSRHQVLWLEYKPPRSPRH
jgi:hypothetical protein